MRAWGLHRDDRYKQLKIMQDADLIIAECNDLIAHHGLDVEAARDVVVKAMLEDQPLPLKGGGRSRLKADGNAALSPRRPESVRAFASRHSRH